MGTRAGYVGLAAALFMGAACNDFGVFGDAGGGQAAGAGNPVAGPGGTGAGGNGVAGAGVGGVGMGGAAVGGTGAAEFSGPLMLPAEIDLPGLQVWNRADGGVTATSDGAVATWGDQSGRTNDAIQQDVPSRPVVVVSAINGHPGLQFDGLDDSLLIANDPGLNPADGSFLYLAVGRWLSGSGSYQAWAGKTSPRQGTNWRAFRTDQAALRVYWGTDAEAYAPSMLTAPDGADVIMGWGRDATTSEIIYIVGGEIERVQTPFFGSGNNGSPMAIGADTNTHHSNVLIAEQMFYMRELDGFTDMEIEATVGYLQSRYGL